MEIPDLLAPEGVIAALQVSDKAQLLRELSQRAAKALRLAPGPILDALRSRESLGSTGVGQGIALPHARVNGLERFFGLFARLVRPVDFESIDERPVDLVFLLLTPQRTGNDHLAALACVSRRLRDREVATRLRGAKTDSQVYQILAGVSEQ